MAPTLSVFVPAFNAAETLRGVIERIPDEAWRMIRAVHIVNDGSTDTTATVASVLEREYDAVHLFSADRNRGYGETVRQGMTLCLAAETDYLACLHADGQYPPPSSSPSSCATCAIGVSTCCRARATSLAAPWQAACPSTSGRQARR